MRGSPMFWIERAYYDIFCHNSSKYYPWNHPRWCKTCALMEGHAIVHKKVITDYERYCLRGGIRKKIFDETNVTQRVGCFSWMARLKDLLPLYQRMLPYPLFDIPESIAKSQKTRKKRGKSDAKKGKKGRSDQKVL